MSLHLDGIRNRSKGESRDGGAVRTNAVEHAVRDRRPVSRRGLPAEQIIGIAAGAMAVGFLAVALPAYWAATQPLPQAVTRPLARPMVQKRLREEAPAPLDQIDTSADLHNNLGVAYLLARQLDAAAAQLKVALVIDPGNIQALVNLALVHKASDRTAEARELLQRAVATHPHHAGSHYNLAVVADEGGDTVTAAAHDRAFLEYGAENYPELASAVRLRLATLESG